jgi:hypothetical protein
MQDDDHTDHPTAPGMLGSDAENLPQLKTENSIATMPGNRAAWFRDSEGNILGLVELG